jgi:hypothetical protein
MPPCPDQAGQIQIRFLDNPHGLAEIRLTAIQRNGSAR